MPAPHAIDLNARALPPEAGLAVAFSGGLDSRVLLQLLAEADWARARGLRVLHVDHGLHADSARWAEHCRRDALGLGLDISLLRAEVPSGSGGLEERARRARHAALQAALCPGEVLVMAHHQDDQAETFLLRALRGAGERGLGGMRALRRFGTGWLWRPLLGAPRSALEHFARVRGLRWIDDPSNLDPRHDRNFLRHAVLPLLRQRWPHAAETLALSAGLSAQADARLASLDAIDLARAQLLDPRALDLQVLRAWEPARRARVLRAWLQALGCALPPPGVMAQIERELLHARADSEAEARWREHRLRAWRDALHLLPELRPLPIDLDVAWQGGGPVALPDGHAIALCNGLGEVQPDARLPRALQLRARQGGERIRLSPQRPSQCVKTLLQSLGVPPWLRPHLPFLWNAEGELVAVGDLLLREDLRAALSANGLCLRWLGPNGQSSIAGVDDLAMVRRPSAAGSRPSRPAAHPSHHRGLRA
ncbi:tRNA lysidine(34) synthetase TilS [Aquimonas voraii]|nr:tRNA lysidine(34) synthetase TilS [Aquimonas voraii]